MPRKKETGHILQAGFDIFEQPLPEGDRGVLLKSPYRRKQLAGFVPLWNEFFRCYHLAGVSPDAVYLWAYLRQYEHERREWNAVSDISWPGRRDIADALGVSITHLPNLLNELRRAGLVTFQLVLPGFEELAESIGASVEAVRDKAAEYGVNPKVDATLYRTADPFTKSEFALQTRLKYCKGCKVVRYCEGARDAQALLSENQKNLKPVARPSKALGPLTRTNALPEVPPYRRVETAERPLEPEFEAVTADRIYIDTVEFNNEIYTDSKKIQPPTQYRVSDRIRPDSDTATKKIRTPNPNRVKTNMYKTASNNQLEESTSMTPSKLKTTLIANQVVVENDSSLENEKLEQVITEATRLAETEMLRQFGFDPQTSLYLAEKVARFGKDGLYIQDILQYARENARQNPHGLARYLIERGEERLNRRNRWQQQNMFGAAPSQPETGDFAEATLDAGEPETETVPAPETAALELDPYAAVRAKIAQAHGIAESDLTRWSGFLQILAISGSQIASNLFRSSVGYEDSAGILRVVMRNLFDQRRAVSHREQLERVIVQATGKMPRIEFEY
jgi:hypothetical protein